MNILTTLEPGEGEGLYICLKCKYELFVPGQDEFNTERSIHSEYDFLYNCEFLPA